VLISTVGGLCGFAALVIILHGLIPEAWFLRVDAMSMSHSIAGQGSVQRKTSTALGFAFTFGFIPIAISVALTLYQANSILLIESLQLSTNALPTPKTRVAAAFTVLNDSNGDCPTSFTDVSLTHIEDLACARTGGGDGNNIFQEKYSEEEGGCVYRFWASECTLARNSALEVSVPWTVPYLRYEVAVSTAHPGREHVVGGAITPVNATGGSIWRTHFLHGLSTVVVGAIPSFFNDTVNGDGIDANLVTGYALSLPDDIAPPGVAPFGTQDALVGEEATSWAVRIVLQRSEVISVTTKTLQQTQSQLASAVVASVLLLTGGCLNISPRTQQ